MKPAATLKGMSKLQVLHDAEADYRAGVLSVSAVARKHGLAESTLRRDARRLGWTKLSQASRRRLVSTGITGAQMASDVTNEQIRQIQAEAAAQDVVDMHSGLLVARRCLMRLLDLVDTVDDPRDLKTIVEANRAAIETIRKIRSLDAEQAPQETSLLIDISDGFAELRAAFAKRLGSLVPV